MAEPKRLKWSKVQETKQAEALLLYGQLARDEAEPFSAAIYFSFIVNNLPAAQQAPAARAALLELEKTNPDILKVLRQVLGGR